MLLGFQQAECNLRAAQTCALPLPLLPCPSSISPKAEPQSLGSRVASSLASPAQLQNTTSSPGNPGITRRIPTLSCASPGSPHPHSSSPCRNSSLRSLVARAQRHGPEVAQVYVECITDGPTGWALPGRSRVPAPSTSGGFLSFSRAITHINTTQRPQCQNTSES